MPGQGPQRKERRFVLHKHIRSQSVHWDLMLQAGRVLWTFRLNRPPEEWPPEGCQAERIFDHPLKFLSYEGSVNNGEGRVEMVDSGTYELLSRDEDKIELQLQGKVLKGRFELTLK